MLDLTPQEIEQALEVCEKATPGEWAYDTGEMLAVVQGAAQGEGAWVVFGEHPECGFRREEDGKFCELAHDLLPRALRELQRAREDTARLETLLAAIKLNAKTLTLANCNSFGFADQWWANVRGKYTNTGDDGRAVIDAAKEAEHGARK